MSGRLGPVRFEVVCTGNICRSPFVHVLLADALERVSPGEFLVSSSGTHALAGNPPDGGVRAQARQRGLSLSEHRAMQTTPAALADADIVLVMEKKHRQAVIDESPAAAPRTFLLKEFASLLADLDAQRPWQQRLADSIHATTRSRWRTALRTMGAVRESRRRDDDELDDPFGRHDGAFEVMADEAERAVQAIVAFELATRELSQPNGIPPRR